MPSHKQIAQGKANALCHFAVVMSAACVVCRVVEVLALLGSIKGSFCCSSAARAIVDHVAAAVEDKLGPSTRLHKRSAGCGTQLES